jgi:hypothetical protein
MTYLTLGIHYPKIGETDRIIKEASQILRSIIAGIHFSDRERLASDNMTELIRRG